MGTRPKELHLGKSLEDLSLKYKLGDLRNIKLKHLCNTARKIFEMAERCWLEKDEEQSFVYYMKYFTVIDAIRKNPEYPREKEYVHTILGSPERQNDAMEKTAILSNSLQRRYKLLEEQKREEILRKERGVNGRLQKMDIAKNVVAAPSSSITASQLYSLLENQNSILIMDCRPSADYNSSRINYNFGISIPEEILLPGTSAGKINNCLHSEVQALWQMRSLKEFVILVDWMSKGPEPVRDTALWRLKDILENWDPDVEYRSPITMLEGGYENFIMLYPMKSTNPNVSLPSNYIQNEDILEEIEYPSLSDITMKDESFLSLLRKNDTSIASRPDIDRNSKAAAIQMYSFSEKAPKVFEEIIEEQEQLANKSFSNAKELYNAEIDWNKMDTEGAPSDQNTAREKELLNNLLQLENKQRDYELENDQLREEIRQLKQREHEAASNRVASSAVPTAAVQRELSTSAEAAAKRIEELKNAERKIDEQREKLAIEREKKLSVAREQKRHLPKMVDADELNQPRSKIPQFDRTIKPAPLTAYADVDRVVEREFSPVFGSVGKGLSGLKNLGNTCYMNSIMQCLSNTKPLAEYFTDNYRNHINYSNHTKGRVVEEVAAVVNALWLGQYKYIASKDLRYVIGQYQNIFRGVDQQDSHEFLTILMDLLHSDLQTLLSKSSLKENLPASDKAWRDFTESKESFILRLFYGQIKSTVKCMECSKESATYECFSNLSLELPPSNNRCQIQTCLDLYFNGERIKGWNCPKCKQKRDAIKKLDISKLPPVLVIHLKRFYADSDSMSSTYRKKQVYVNFPLTELDMMPYIARSQMKSKTIDSNYNLYAVSNHYGSMESGHYTAFCKSSAFNKWYKFDDHMVSSLDHSDVISSAAYILFYTKMP